MSNHIYRLCAALILFAVLMTPIESRADMNDPEHYKTTGVTVVSSLGIAPMAFIGMDGQPSGYLIDLWKVWSTRTGVPVKFKLYPWKESIDLAANGGDVIAGLYFNEERNQYLDFSYPYRNFSGAIFVMKEKDADINTILSTYDIGVMGGGNSEHFMRTRHPEARLTVFPTTRDVALALVAGKIDAVAGDNPTIGYEVGFKGRGEDLLIKKILYTRGFHAAVLKGNRSLLELVNKGFAQITEKDHELLYNRWFIVSEEATHWIWIISGFGILAIGFGLLLFFDRR